MVRARLYMMGTGAALTCVLAVIAALLLPARPVRHAPHKRASCTRDAVIRVVWVCGRNVVYVNPDGARVYIGKTEALRAPHSHALMNAADR